MTRVIICDNNPIFADFLKEEVLKLLPTPAEVCVCLSAEDLREKAKIFDAQIAILDIHLGETPENGISLAQELFPAGCGTSVIFVTGYIEYVSDVYEADHVYFLRKPVEPDYLKKALDKALQVPDTEATTFAVQMGGKLQVIDMREVLCIESFYRKLHIRLWNETIVSYGSISSLPELVQKHMISCHKSFLVNPDYIRTMDRQKFLLKDGSEVPISRSRYSESRQAFLDYCSRELI